jgi:hypothetical protein
MQSEEPFVSCFIKQTGYKTVNVAVWPYTFQKMKWWFHIFQNDYFTRLTEHSKFISIKCTNKNK